MKTEHDLPFEVTEWSYNPMFQRFRVGTCHGLYGSVNGMLIILAVMNDEPGNGHLNDVFQWFENGAKKDGMPLVVVEIWNQSFKKHLIEKRGFAEDPELVDGVIKYFDK